MYFFLIHLDFVGSHKLLILSNRLWSKLLLLSRPSSSKADDDDDDDKGKKDEEEPEEEEEQLITEEDLVDPDVAEYETGRYSPQLIRPFDLPPDTIIIDPDDDKKCLDFARHQVIVTGQLQVIDKYINHVIIMAYQGPS